MASEQLRYAFASVLLVVLGVAGVALRQAHAQAHACSARLQAEVARVERQFAAERPPSEDAAAQQRWLRQRQVAMDAVLRQVAECERQLRALDELARAAPPEPLQGAPARSASRERCMEEVRQRGEYIVGRYSGRELTAVEEARRQAEEHVLGMQRDNCLVPAP